MQPVLIFTAGERSRRVPNGAAIYKQPDTTYLASRTRHGLRAGQLGEQVRLGGPFCVVACFRIQIPSAEQFKTRLGTKVGPRLSPTRSDFVQHLVQSRRGREREAERNTNQTRSGEKLGELFSAPK